MAPRVAQKRVHGEAPGKIRSGLGGSLLIGLDRIEELGCWSKEELQARKVVGSSSAASFGNSGAALPSIVE